MLYLKNSFPLPHPAPPKAGRKLILLLPLALIAHLGAQSLSAFDNREILFFPDAFRPLAQRTPQSQGIYAGLWISQALNGDISILCGFLFGAGVGGSIGRIPSFRLIYALSFHLPKALFSCLQMEVMKKKKKKTQEETICCLKL